MVAKFKTSLVEGPAAIEKRQGRQAIAAARAERAVQREEARQRQERELAKQAEIAARQQPTPRERPPMRHRAKRPNRQNEMRCWRLNRRHPRCPLRGTEGSKEKAAAWLLSPKPGASPPISLSCRTC